MNLEKESKILEQAISIRFLSVIGILLVWAIVFAAFFYALNLTAAPLSKLVLAAGASAILTAGLTVAVKKSLRK